MTFNYTFCCQRMHDAIHINKVIEYYDKTREYGILVEENSIMTLVYCPWCGSNLPKELVDEIFEVLEKEYGIPWQEADIEHGSNLPEEFKTDEWWKKRGL